MKGTLLILLLISVFCLPVDVAASGVFKCVNDSGQVTFAFTACPEKVARAKIEKQSRPSVEQQMADLDIIDVRISHVNRQFRALRLGQEEDLQRSNDAQARRLIRDNYQQQTGDLLQQLSELKSERGRLVQGSITLLTRSN